MKRSEVNVRIVEAEHFFTKSGFILPDFAFWSPADWKKHKAECAELIACGLGWDVTDFGSDCYEKCGLMLFTLRNGLVGSSRYPKPYAEKIMMVKPEQETPMHCHYRKREDIINRGGEILVFQLRPNTGGKPDSGPIRVSVNGRPVTVEPGDELRLQPGSSLTIEPGVFHTFWGDLSAGPVMTGEVSSVNDDNTDNCFAEPRKRFPGWDEDVLPERLTIADYAAFLK